MFIRFTLWLFFVMFPVISGAPKRTTLGGVFPEDSLTAQAFTLSVTEVNRMRHNLTDELANVFFVTEIVPYTTDIVDLTHSVCSLVSSHGVAAIFGPHGELTSAQVESMCDTMDIPNIIAKWDAHPRMSAINLYPESEALAQLYLDLVVDFGWKSFTVIFDTTNSLIRLRKVLERWGPRGYPVTLRNLGPGPNYRPILKEIKHAGDKNFIIDCEFEILEEVLTQCLQVGLFFHRNRIMITSLDLQSINLDPFRYSGANFTGIRIVDPADEYSQKIFSDVLYQLGVEDITKVPLETALIYDGVQLFARAFKNFKDAVKMQIKPLECADNGTTSWSDGTTLSNFIRSTEIRGLTGPIKFHTGGFRSDFAVDIFNVNEKGVESVGMWNSTSGLEWRPQITDVVGSSNAIANQTFKVLISLLDPYNMLTESSNMRTGNDRYEGFTIDIIHELAKILHFNYTFIEQVDKNTGSPLPDGRWTGMIGKIMSGEADLGITDLTITAQRETAVDFTMPFLNLGIGILFIKPRKAPPSLFSFLSPLSSEVWWYLIGAWIFSSLLIYVVARMCPAEWTNPYPCIEEPTELENQFTLKNTFWFTIGAMMQQGSELAPIGTSTRMLAIAWWFFCLIIANSYTANLAAFLTVETSVRPFKSAEELASLNGDIKYGAKRNGATFNFFRNSNYSTYVKMYEYMAEHDDEVMMPGNDEGVKRVLEEDGTYAFLMESTSISYSSQRECNLTQIGEPLDSKGYGIAMRKGFPYFNQFNTALLQLQERGKLTELKDKWWKEKRGGGKCTDEPASSAAAELTMDNVGGVFLVLVVGIALSFVYSVCEMLYDLLLISLKEKVSFKEELREEVRFIIKFKGQTKPVRRRKTSSASGAGTSTRNNSLPSNVVPQVVTTLHEEDEHSV